MQKALGELFWDRLGAIIWQIIVDPLFAAASAMIGYIIAHIGALLTAAACLIWVFLLGYSVGRKEYGRSLKFARALSKKQGRMFNRQRLSIESGYTQFMKN
ncbi:hypothetical protein [Maricaulis salignorans]|uniref:hypothetical protein n=1 Tax=Maricaulis salignorans TaxID=144026 RepID=UPI000B8A0CB9|nr:hypothetical protein [Maricaulis salignorans]